MGFKKDFVWGASTAAYQIEGAYKEDGKGLSIWDVFSHQKGKIYGDANGDVACDSYHRIDEDVSLMKELGIKAYRFSVSWPRIIPDGTGKINQKGIDYYNRLIDKLIENNIEPFLTMYHWDLPYALHCKGGWLNPEIVDWFAYYAKVIAENFGDRVKNISPINEPQCIISHGYRTGIHAPGLQLGLKDLLIAGHNLLKANGAAVKVLRKMCSDDTKIGMASVMINPCPVSDSKQDLQACKMFQDNPDEHFFLFSYTYWFDAIFYGKYPDSVEDLYKKYNIEISQEDRNLINNPVDYIGANIYFGTDVKADSQGNPEVVPFENGHPRTSCKWFVNPRGMYYGCKDICERYKVPVYITENGMSCHDWISLDGKVHDPQREDFLHRYFLEMKRAVDDGIDIRGYFEWSLLDNFEWAEGYNERFGMIYVDFKTQKRTIKDSAYWYKNVIMTNGEEL